MRVLSDEAIPSLREAPDRVLGARLRQLGLSPELSVETHTNRTVMVSVTQGGSLRVHRGYCHAPDRVLRAIVRFVNPRISPERRRAAEDELLSFPVRLYAPDHRGPMRLDRPRPGDDPIMDRLGATHRRLNNAWFDGQLRDIPFRLSGRMKTSLGELCLDARTKEPINIAISRRHLRRDGWQEVEHTVLHEMVHQWQAETGKPVDHGTAFRRKASEVGIEPAARRDIRRGAGVGSGV